MKIKQVLFTGLLILISLISRQTFSQYIVDFEGVGETKTGYATGTVKLSGLDWDMTNALIGTDTNDFKNGVRSARLRGYGTSSISMLEDKESGLGTLSFLYRRYSSENQVDWKVEYSTDGGSSWIQAGNTFISPATDEVQQFEETLNIAGNVRIRIKRATETGTTNRRLNIDDIILTDFVGGGNIPPVIANIVQIPAKDITSTTSVQIQASITDTDGTIASAQLDWGTQSSVYPNTIQMQAITGDTYGTLTDIPAQPNGTTVYYRIQAIDNDGATAYSGEQSYSVKDPLTTTLPYNETFDNDLSGVYTYTVSGTKPWYHYQQSAAANAHQGDFPEEHWLVLPGINLDNYSNEVLTFISYAQFGTYDAENYLKLFYSTNYQGIGNVQQADWKELAFDKPAVTDNELSAPSGNIDISAINGQSVHFAFKYYSNGAPTRWRVDDIHIFQNVDIPATHLVFSGFPDQGETAAVIAGFTVEAKRDDETVDNNYNGDITLSVSQGDDNLTGTLTKSAVAGIANFDDIIFSEPGTYQLLAQSGTLTPAESEPITISSVPALTEILLPQFIANGANGNRVPYAFRVQLSNLLPNSVYKYTNQVVDETDAPTTNGAGNVIYANADGTITRQTANPSFNVPGSYGEFTTDQNGSFTGWFLVEPTNNARFAAGKEIFMRIRLNGGDGGNNIQTRLTTHNTVQVINFGTDAANTLGTGIVGLTDFSPNNLAMLFDNMAGNGRPLYGTSIESTGIDFQSDNTWAVFYKDLVAGNNGAWGGIIPNLNPNGVKLMQERSLITGNIVSSETSIDGMWDDQNTVNPDGGKANVLVINIRQTPLITMNPTQLDGFEYITGQGPSDVQSFSVSGANLNTDITITGSNSFEISETDEPNFNATSPITLNPINGTIAPTQLYVRMKAGLAAGDYNENILITLPGTEQKILTLSGNVIEGINPPQAHVTQFTAIAEAFDKIRTEWTDAQPEAEAYLIKASKDGFEAITPPVNGIEEINSDMVRNLPAGTETCTFTELEQLTEYFFKIYPYNGNGEHITYKTDGQVPQASATTLTGPSMTTEILPLYFGANNNRLTYAFRMAFNGLNPDATYKYINQVVSDNDGPTVAGAGVPIFVQADGSFNRSSSTSFSNPDQHGLFTTDNNGEFAGWFMIEPTTNARFAPGNTVYMRIRLNDGQDGNNPVWYFTSEGVQMIGFGTEAGPESGTGIRGTSKFMSGNFVMLYGADNRPLAGTHIEVSGIDFAAINSYAAFYRNEVNGIAGAWGTIVPNDNPTGVIRIEERSRESGEAISVLTNPTGLWDQTNTVNPRGGLTNILVIETDQEPELTLEPHQLTGFQYVFDEGPSLTQSFTISGRALEDQVNIAEPVAFEISLTDGAAFIAEPGLNLPQQGGTLTPTQLFVRMKAGLAVGDYNENILITSPGTEQKTLTLSGNVIEAIYTPEAYPTNFTADVNSKTKLTVSWTDAIPAAEGYVVKASSIGFNDIQAPIDGQIETESQSVKLATAGIQTVAFTGLQQATTYYFQIFPFNGSGDRIRYKTDGTVPQAFAATLGDAMLTDLILPQFIQGVNGTNNTRLPFAFRVKLSNLIPNAIYRYTNQAVSNTDTPSAAGAGNPIYVNGNIFFRTTNPGFVNEGQYGVFSTNASGEYTGWFMIEPTGNIRFTPGNTIQMRIRLNDGNNGTTAATYLTTGDITVLNFGETNTPEAGTAIRATSSATPKNFALIYNNITGSGRPLYGTSIEVTDIDFAANTTYPAFYRNEVAGQIGAWGGIVPNMNQAGVRRIEERSLLNGNTIKVHTSENGIWDYTFTSNPTGGLNEVIVLNLGEEDDKSSLSGQLKIFNAAETSIQSPTPQTVFYVQLFENGMAVRPRQIVSSNQALQLESYFSFVNLESGRNYTLRIWESNQYNNLSLSWLWNNWGGATSVDALLINHMSVMSPLVNSFPWLLGVDGTSLSDFAFQVADVNGNGSINASDALSLMNRIIGMPGSDPFAGNKHNFHIAGSLVEDHHSLRYPAAPDIQFEAAGNYQPTTPLNEIYYEAVLPELQAGTNVFNIYFSPVGDVNASFAPQHNKQSHRKPGVYAEKTVYEADTILLPLFLSEAAKLSACNISFNYDPQQIEVKAIYGAPIYYHNAETHMITMGWLEYEPFYLAHDIPIAHIEAVIHQLPDDGIVLSVNSDNTSFASPEAIELSHLTLKTLALRKAANADLLAFAFPNPFTEHTTVQVQLPEEGTLSLLVFDELGRMVYGKTTEASSGTYQLIIDSNSLTGSAVYHYTVMLNGRAKQYYLKGKLIRVQ